MDFTSVFIRKILFPTMKKLKGNRIRSHLSDLKETEKKPLEELKHFQETKLKKLLLYSIENIPAYRPFEYLKKEIEENPSKALKQFPILNKQQFASSKDQYLNPNSDKKSLIPNQSGGSTGEPVSFFLDRDTVEWYEAARWRGLSWWDIQIGDRSVMVWGAPVELTKNQHMIYRFKERFLKNRIIISAYNLNPNSIRYYMEMIHKFKPKYLYGYASALYMLSELMVTHGYKLNFTPKAVVSTSETLHDYQREMIEKAFGCPTVNEYGAKDAGILAYECPQGHMHISVENVYIETISMDTQENLNQGESGFILVTDLNNYTMPRIRYMLGDVGSIDHKSISCDVHLPTMKSIEGREDDFFVSENGELVHGHYFNHLFRSTNGIRQFQIVQLDKSTVNLKIVKGPLFDENELHLILDKIKQKMGKINLTIEYVNHIPPTSSGKFRYAIRKFPL